MENFTLYNPTKLFFGVGCTSSLGETVSLLGKKALIMTGRGSARNNGLLDRIAKQLSPFCSEIVLFEGIKSNPLETDVDKAVQVCRSNDIEVIIALGGGSVLDSAKITALCAPGNIRAWDMMTNKTEPQKALPIIAVLTLAATGSEMNPFAVLQNHQTQQKIGFGNPLAFPRFSFLDPEFTATVPKNYTAYGIADTVAHALENWFGAGNSPLSDQLLSGIIRECIEVSPLLLSDTENIENRARIMIASTMALNGTCSVGKKYGDWGVHSIGHILSLLFDTPHGATLSIAYPAWMKHMLPIAEERICKLGKMVFDTEDGISTISALQSFFDSISCPVHLEDVIPDAKTQLNTILECMKKNKCSGYIYPLHPEDHYSILNKMLME